MKLDAGYFYDFIMDVVFIFFPDIRQVAFVHPAKDRVIVSCLFDGVQREKAFFAVSQSAVIIILKQIRMASSEKHAPNTTEVVVIGGLFRMICLFSENFCMMIFCRKKREKPRCQKAFFALVSQKYPKTLK